jgi:hypothetical protein
MTEHEWEITFTLAPGYDARDAVELFERVERSPAVSGAVLTGTVPVADLIPIEIEARDAKR